MSSIDLVLPSFTVKRAAILASLFFILVLTHMLDISFSSYFLYLQGNPAEQTEQEEEREQIRFGEPCENTRKH
jgi:hypothetical protein